MDWNASRFEMNVERGGGELLCRFERKEQTAWGKFKARNDVVQEYRRARAAKAGRSRLSGEDDSKSMCGILLLGGSGESFTTVCTGLTLL